MLSKLRRLGIASIATISFISSADASLDLLAGVEAGIETDTSMTASDLEHTQHILSSQVIGTPSEWVNDITGTTYKITIDHHYSYGHYPCVSYDLSITKEGVTEIKSLDACKNSSGQWISITPASTAL